MRTLPASPRPSRRAAPRDGRCMVGHRDPDLVRWPRSPAPSRADVCPARWHPDNAQARLFSDGSPEPRSHLQWATLVQPSSALPALSYDSRCARASSAALVECLSSPSARRSFLRTLLNDLSANSRLALPLRRRVGCHWPVVSAQESEWVLIVLASSCPGSFASAASL
jgi:hypothetical protein